MLSEILIGIIVILLSILYLYRKYVLYYYLSKRGVFYVEPNVRTEKNIITKKLSMGVFFRDMYLKHKNYPIFGTCLFMQPILVATDLDIVRAILTKNFSSFDDRGFFNNKGDPLSANLLHQKGKQWKDMRTRMTPFFAVGKVKQMFSLMDQIGEHFIKHLEAEAEMKATVDIGNLFERFTMDIIISLAFGTNPNCIENPKNGFQYWGDVIYNLHPIWYMCYLFSPKFIEFLSVSLAHREMENFFIDVFRGNVEYRRAHNIVKHDFLNLLMKIIDTGEQENNKKNADTSSIAEGKITMAEGAAQSFIFFAAGYETSASTGSYCLYELAQYQDIQENVRREIDEVCNKHGGLSYDAINEMTYLHKVVNETLRKYPTIPVFYRICTKDIELPEMKIRVSKGTSVVVPVFGIHRDPSIYPDPDRFDPERFNEEKTAARHSYAFLPFGEGPRSCIGMKIGYLQTKVGLIKLLSKYKFTLDPETPIPLTHRDASIVLKIKDKIRLVIEPR